MRLYNCWTIRPKYMHRSCEMTVDHKGNAADRNFGTRFAAIIGWW